VPMMYYVRLSFPRSLKDVRVIADKTNDGGTSR
jgi:hypothetical protein